MPEAMNQGVKICYDVMGQGRPLMLLHGWCCDRTWWNHAGYTDDLQRDFRVINVDLRGHGASDKPHEPSAYHREVSVSDVLAVADAEDLDRFAIWGLSYGGWIGWMTAYAVPERIPALISSGSWDPLPGTDADWQEFDESEGEAMRRGGMRGLVDLFEEEDGEAFSTEFPPWAAATTLQADPAALLAIQARELVHEGIPTLEGFPVPVLLISGEKEDPKNGVAASAAVVPNGQSLRLRGLGHGGACAAAELTLPTARAFLDRWFA